ncbi:IS110 family transposase [Corynebacterium hylobatis]|uniref:IS110 family transposase n=2 Tax=Corynebacterium hylobatis TaxID=1859290 RepID=A0A430HUK0_9CORY|nr:IS110 family transposase [Corynebacterium hylobatis]
MHKDTDPAVIVGIDTHADTHHLAVITSYGRPLVDLKIPATPAGYRQALDTITKYPRVDKVGIECTGSYGAGITREFTAAGYRVVEVNRPNKFDRRRQGKTDQFDAYVAAEAVLSGRATAIPKSNDGLVQSLRVLRTTRTSAVRDRTATINQITTMLVAGPDNLREKYRGLTTAKLITTLAATRPPAEPITASESTAVALRLLARRYKFLNEQATDLTHQITRLLKEHAPALMDVYGAGPDSIAQLLITAGDNPERLRSERHFAALAGASPIPASSGKTNRHRLNRGGDRQANSALHRIILVRMHYEQRTRDYVERRIDEGKSKREIMRCLKRYLARELFPLIVATLKPVQSRSSA